MPDQAGNMPIQSRDEFVPLQRSALAQGDKKQSKPYNNQKERMTCPVEAHPYLKRDVMVNLAYLNFDSSATCSVKKMQNLAATR